MKSTRAPAARESCALASERVESSCARLFVRGLQLIRVDRAGRSPEHRRAGVSWQRADALTWAEERRMERGHDAAMPADVAQSSPRGLWREERVASKERSAIFQRRMKERARRRGRSTPRRRFRRAASAAECAHRRPACPWKKYLES